jgi:hypothetical protein
MPHHIFPKNPKAQTQELIRRAKQLRQEAEQAEMSANCRQNEETKQPKADPERSNDGAGAVQD